MNIDVDCAERTVVFVDNTCTYSDNSNLTQQATKEPEISNMQPQETSNPFVMSAQGEDSSFETVSAISLTPEVFSEVQATLAAHTANLVAESIEMLLSSHALKLKVLKDKDKENENYSVSGTLRDILSAHVLLQSILLASHQYISLQADKAALNAVLDSQESSPTHKLLDDTQQGIVKETEVAQRPAEIPTNDDELDKAGNNLSSSEATLVSEHSYSAAFPNVPDTLQSCAKDVAENSTREEPETSASENVSEKTLRRSKRLQAVPRRIWIETEEAEEMLLNEPGPFKSKENTKSGDPDKGKMDSTKEQVPNENGFLVKHSKFSWRHYDAKTPFKYFCDMCSFKTKRISHFNKHKLIHDKISTLYKCQKCPFTTLRQSHLRRHEVLHSNTVHQCNQCSYKTDQHKFLEKHIKMKHIEASSSEDKPKKVYQCTECSYQTTKQQFFLRHTRIHRVRSKTHSIAYHCEQCNYRTNRKEHYVRHCNNVHSEKRPFLCHICGKAFKRADALRQHSLIHGDASGMEKSSCPKCNKVFRSRSHMHEHQAVHTNVRMFLCEICGASFKTRSIQRKHIQSIHTNPRAHVCHLCNKRFNTQFAMRRHIKTHNAGEQKEKQLNVETNNLAASNKEEPMNVSVSVVEEMNIGTAEGHSIVLTTESNQNMAQTVPVLSATPVIATFGSDQLPITTDMPNVTVTAQTCVSASDLLQQFPTTLLYLTSGLS